MRGARKAYCYALFGLFAAVSTLPVLFLNTEQESRLENRRLAEKPEFPDQLGEVGSYLSRWAAYVNDRYGFKESAILLNNRLSRMLGSRVHEKVLIGKDGWLFFVGGERDRPLDDYYGTNLLSEAELEQWARELSERQEWLAERGARYLFVIAPNKLQVFDEYLPDNYERSRRLTRARQLTDYLRSHTTVAVVDLSGDIEAGKGRSSEFDSFGPFGTHWNAYGAALGFNAIARALGREYLGEEPFQYSAASFRLDRAGVDRDLQQMVEGEIDQPSEGPAPIEGIGLERWHRVLGAASEGWSASGDYELSLDESDERVALAFGDSFFLQLAPYFSHLAGRLRFRRGYPSTEELKEAFAAAPAALVVEQRVERYLWRTPEAGK